MLFVIVVVHVMDLLCFDVCGFCVLPFVLFYVVVLCSRWHWVVCFVGLFVLLFVVWCWIMCGSFCCGFVLVAVVLCVIEFVACCVLVRFVLLCLYLFVAMLCLLWLLCSVLCVVCSIVFRCGCFVVFDVFTCFVLICVVV